MTTLSTLNKNSLLADEVTSYTNSMFLVDLILIFLNVNLFAMKQLLCSRFFFKFGLSYLLHFVFIEILVFSTYVKNKNCCF